MIKEEQTARKYLYLENNKMRTWCHLTVCNLGSVWIICLIWLDILTSAAPGMFYVIPIIRPPSRMSLMLKKVFLQAEKKRSCICLRKHQILSESAPDCSTRQGFGFLHSQNLNYADARDLRWALRERRMSFCKRGRDIYSWIHFINVSCDSDILPSFSSSPDFWSRLCISTIHLNFIILHLKATSRTWMYNTLAYSCSYELADRC